MQRYFFDTCDDGEVVVDDVGTRLAGLGEARQVAATALAEHALEVLPDSLNRTLAVEVRDSDNKRVLTMQITFEARILV